MFDSKVQIIAASCCGLTEKRTNSEGPSDFFYMTDAKKFLSAQVGRGILGRRAKIDRFFDNFKIFAHISRAFLTIRLLFDSVFRSFGVGGGVGGGRNNRIAIVIPQIEPPIFRNFHCKRLAQISTDKVFVRGGGIVRYRNPSNKMLGKLEKSLSV